MRFKRVIVTTLLLVFSFITPISATENPVNLYYFHAEGCSTCAKETEFLNGLVAKDPNLHLYAYEIAFNSENQAFAEEVSKLLPSPINLTPTLVIGQRVIVGFVEGTTDQTIQDEIAYAKTNVIKDVIGEVLGISEVRTITNDGLTQIRLPFFGLVDAKTVSLPLLSVVLGTLDGFNPCAMWVLLLLISMLFHLEERWKRWFLGSLFLGTTALMYLFFMVSWLNITILFGTITPIRWLIAAIAVGGGVYNIYRFLTTEPGCEVMDEKKRVKISQRIKQIFNQPVFVLAAIGVVVLAVSVNLVELICSAGLPVLFTQVLSLNALSPLDYGFYMGLYLLFFMADDIIIFIIAMKTSELTGISSKYARNAHLVGGIIMVILGILMVLKPAWLMLNFG